MGMVEGIGGSVWQCMDAREGIEHLVEWHRNGHTAHVECNCPEGNADLLISEENVNLFPLFRLVCTSFWSMPLAANCTRSSSESGTLTSAGRPRECDVWAEGLWSLFQ